ncbi:MAG: ethanolamine ammonia-lyase subunit EutC [Myxococcales bacterium]|nr:ethanolamine ammonia-lyase subunit EutC [Myxococcales bacterium]
MATELDEDAIAAIVRAVRKRLEQESAPVAPVDRYAPPKDCGGDAGHACTSDPRPVHSVKDPVFEAMLPRLVAATSSQIAVGHTGGRFRTDLYLRVREGHADARDAVHSDVPPEWPVKNGLISLETRCSDRDEYLLYPNHGRRLSDTSRATVQAYASTRPDVQIIVGDGLSPNAIVQNGSASLSALGAALQQGGLRTGVSFFVKFARIGVADEIGVLVGARATVMLVGERPGLGTGDSLSFYIAINPKLDQDNAEKNCISNVRPIGIAPSEAAEQTVTILRRGFEAGVGGVALGLGWGRR